MAFPKIALVTGANSGIGYEIVKALLQSDRAYHLLLGSRSLENGKLAAERLSKECLGSRSSVEPIQVDLNSDDSIEKAYEQVQAGPGRVDVLINNAGTYNISQRAFYAPRRIELS